MQTCAKSLALLAIAASCAEPDRSGLWHDRNACAASANDYCLKYRDENSSVLCDNYPAADGNAFLDFLRNEAPEGTTREEAFRRLGEFGFECGSHERQYPTPTVSHGCRKDVGEGFPITRNWMVNIEVDAGDRVVAYHPNCAMTGP